MTLINVASKAGVSHMTVSRVINGDPHVAEATAAHVKNVISSLGYKPPPTSKRFRRPSRKQYGIHTGNVALLFPDPNSLAMRTPISAALAHGIEGHLFEHRLNLMVTHFRSDTEMPPCLDRRQVDGVIVRRGDLTAEALQALTGFPVVWVLMSDVPQSFGDEVYPDNAAIGRAAADRLIELGCRSLAVLQETPGHLQLRLPPAYAARRSAFITRATSAGLHVETVAPEADFEHVAWDGLFVVSAVDGQSNRAFTALTKAGRELGRDVEVVVVDEANYLRDLNSRVSIVDPCMEAVGRTAAETLIWRLANPKAPRRTILIEPALIKRT